MGKVTTNGAESAVGWEWVGLALRCVDPMNAVMLIGTFARFLLFPSPFSAPGSVGASKEQRAHYLPLGTFDLNPRSFLRTPCSS